MKSGEKEPFGSEAERLRSRVVELEQELAEVTARAEGLQRERDFHETVVNSLIDAVYVVDARDCSIVDCNDLFLQEYGLDRETVLGSYCYDVICGRETPCTLPGRPCPVHEALTTGEPTVYENKFHLGDPEPCYLECRTLPVRDKDGNIAQLVHFERDISHRKRIEEEHRRTNRELQRANAFMKNLLMSSAHAVIAADMTGHIVIFNQAAGRITGYTEEEAQNRISIRDIYQGDGAREIMAKLRGEDFGGKGKLEAHETELLHQDGSLIPISLSASIVYEEDQEAATVGFFYDLREQRRMERELDRTRVQLLQAEKMGSIGKLAAGVAHQINNPLGGIIIFAQLILEEYELEEKLREDVERILSDGERCRDIVNELLTFARQTNQKTRLEDINKALQRTHFLLANQALFQNVEFVMNLAPGLPLVPADMQQLNQVFMNLILNAADAMEGRGRITLTTSARPDGKTVRVEIRDSGPGLKEEDIPHLFEPFFTTKEEGKGTGLGLSVAYGIIENHKGRIKARNAPGGGAALIIDLPVQGPIDEEHYA